ncbi:MAG: FHA domain-containing protein [Syntrophobacteraceae bacterium]|jgi:hypothetical protein|nr:FHA domain-containing protein [Syntrophobacteraceae bacterium]
MLDSAIKVFDSIIYPLLTLVVYSGLVYLFRDRISQLELDPKRRTFKISFEKDAEKSKGLAQNVKDKVSDARSLEAAERVVDYASLGARDIVLTAWGRVYQSVMDAFAANGISLPGPDGMPRALRRLGQVSGMDSRVVSLIESLLQSGEDLARATGLFPSQEPARDYGEAASIAVAHLMASIPQPVVGNDPEVQRRQTVVGERFPQPRSGEPAVWLSGIEGKVTGRRYPVEGERFRMGAGSDNDLVIEGDQYVSQRHAELRYLEGGLFISDLGSRNGTYLNGERVTSRAVAVRRGDRIRLGGCTLRIVDGSTSSREPTPVP